MQIPSLTDAMAMVDEANERNPGPWVQHCQYTAAAAERIARYHPDLNPEHAFILGLLHDIGRREGRFHLKHVLDGFRYLNRQGYTDAARICLTHSFPLKEIGAFMGNRDVDGGELNFLTSSLESMEYTEYDRLIQLCDCLALPSGFCLLEKRMIDVALRYGTNPYTVGKWKAVFAVQEDMERATGRSIYTLLPGVVENTFSHPSRK